MKKTWIPYAGILLLALGALTTLQSFTTSDDTQLVRCYTDEIHEKRLETDSIYARAQTEFPTTAASQRAVSTETFTIPVVVHVFHDGSPYGVNSNVSDELIYEAIGGLNASFAGDPFFESEYSGGFTHPYNDAGINFCLATIDPDGNPTTGITRHFPDSIPGYVENGMTTVSLLEETHETNLKALAYWPTADYMNVYVVHKLNGGLSPLGFAYLPPVDGFYDGIVSSSRVFGFTEGTSHTLNNYDRNGTLVHEVGHYLGLYHTFNFTSSCGTETNCNAQGDKCCDTPKTTGSAGCSYLECSDTMVENIMDYSNDHCMDRFSPDQIDRMRTQLVTYRSSLLNNGKCAALDEVDVSATSINIPSQGICTEFYEGINFNLNSFSLDTITHVDIIYQVENGALGMFAWSGQLTLGNPVNVTLPTVEVPFGSNTITVWAYNPNFVPDTNPGNDEVSVTFVNPEGVTVDVQIDFDALPYGIEWELYEVVDGDLVDPPLAFFEEYDNETYSCNSASHSFCLPEGDYQIVVTDLFGNGMSYPFCNGYTSGDFTILNGIDTLNYHQGGWTGALNLPFTVTAGCPPLGDCPWDLDDDQLVGASDIILLLQVFGQFGECQAADFNIDGVVGVDDLLDMISIFGINCQTGMILEADIPESIRAVIQEKTGLDMGVTEIGSLNFSHSSPISINPYQIESMQDVLAVNYYDMSGKQITKDEVAYGIYIARIFMRDGTLETIKFYAQQ